MSDITENDRLNTKLLEKEQENARLREQLAKAEERIERLLSEAAPMKRSTGFSCPVCCAKGDELHAEGCSAGREDKWYAFVNPPAVTINTRQVGGVLCRWWGDGPAPAGVALIDAAVRQAPSTKGEAQDSTSSECVICGGTGQAFGKICDCRRNSGPSD